MARGPGERAFGEVQTEIAVGGGQPIEVDSTSESEVDQVAPLARQLKEAMGATEISGGDAAGIGGSPHARSVGDDAAFARVPRMHEGLARDPAHHRSDPPPPPPQPLVAGHVDDVSVSGGDATGRVVSRPLASTEVKGRLVTCDVTAGSEIR